MGNQTPRLSSLQRTLVTLEAIIVDGGKRSISAIARDTGLPVSTAHRQVLTLVDAGYLRPVSGGRHVAGPRLLHLLRGINRIELVAAVAAPILQRLAKEVRAVAQLGTLDNDMVTYRIKAGRAAGDLFTRIGMQLEGYCSAIGKVMLAHLPPAERDAYLAGGPFVALTSRTIVSPADLAAELDRVRECGFATDEGEIADDLACLAMPVHAAGGEVIAAVSISGRTDPDNPRADLGRLPLLRAAVREIETALSPNPDDFDSLSDQN